jgi:hypothetical protein
VATFGKVRAEVEGRWLAALRALLATAPAVERRASISGIIYEWRFVWRVEEALLPAPAEQRRTFDVPKQLRMLVYFIEKRGEKGTVLENGAPLLRGIVSESLFR